VVSCRQGKYKKEVKNVDERAEAGGDFNRHWEDFLKNHKINPVLSDEAFMLMMDDENGGQYEQ